MSANKRPIVINSSNPLRVVSLFAGCGGLDLGFCGNFSVRNKKLPSNPYKIVFSNDFDPDAAKVYNENRRYFGNHQLTPGDIRKIKTDQVPEYDVLLAGFPCQPFSNAGNRQGIDDKHGRGTLFYECERVIASCQGKTKKERPLAFVFENVRGILSSHMPDGTTVPDEIKKRMKKYGYETSIQLVNASEFGVPQNRYRVLMVGIRDDLPRFEFKELSDVARKFNLPSSKSADHYELLLGSVLCDIPKDAPNYADIWSYSPSGQRMIELIGPCSDGKKALEKFKLHVPLAEISPTITTGRSWKQIPRDRMSPRFQKIFDDPKRYRAPNFYRRFALGEICGTITASGQPENSGITHPFENRRFTAREIARIQTFPDDFVFFSPPISAPYKVIGNAVPPVLGWTIARALFEHLRDCL